MKILPKTKIVATLGPASDTEATLRELFLAGVNVCRINFSHGTHKEHLEKIKLIKKLRKEMKLPIAILTDLQGPKIRVGNFENDTEDIIMGQEFTFTTREIVGTNQIVSISYKRLAEDVKVGSNILVNDGLLDFKVIDIPNKTDVECVALNSGKISNHKGVNIPGIYMNVPFLSKKDIDDLHFAVENGVDFVAASFTQKKENILQVKKIIEELNGTQEIIAKIENQEGLNNAKEILEVADGIMVARGDLGVEVKAALVAFAQKNLIDLANSMSKPVITATQMLESMTQNIRPTRAEVADITNAILDGTSCVMLSAETAVGKYPIESVKMMREIATTTEKTMDYKKLTKKVRKTENTSITNEIAHATCNISSRLNIDTIITATTSGFTARNIARFKPRANILALTSDENIFRRLALFWGVQPVLSRRYTGTDDMIKISEEDAKASGFVDEGELVVLTSGIPVGQVGTTNLLTVKKIF
ncbi:MAG: pyruvate kinase [Treponemataceae bacterium]